MKPLAKEGDVFVAVWGYSMVLVEFYRVTKVYPSGRLVDIEEVAQIETPDGFLQGTTKLVQPVTALPASKQDVARCHRVTVRHDPAGKQSFLLMRDSRRRAWPWHDRAYDFNHCD